jgi:RNA polymerase sigma-70 factor, ECF subfamily
MIREQATPTLHRRPPMVTGTDPDRALLEQIAGGDRAALEALYRRYYPRLYGYLLRLTRRPEVVEEAINDALFVVWRKAADYQGISRPSTWIFGIAYRKGLKALAKNERRDAELDLETLEGPVAEGGPESDLAAAELAVEVTAALGRLPAAQRAVVEMTYYQNLAYREIAEIMSCPVNTVKTRMFHARRRLRELLPHLGLRREA